MQALPRASTSRPYKLVRFCSHNLKSVCEADFTIVNCPLSIINSMIYHTESLWNGLTLLQSAAHFRLGTDSVVCAGFARFPHGSRVADLGCGSGAISLMLLASDPTLHLTGIELQPDAAHLAAENAKQNEVDLTVLEGDLRQIRTLLPAGSMDGCISNPPYFPTGSGRTAAGPLARARSEDTCTPDQLAEAAAWLLPTGGRFVLVHRPERLSDLFFALKTHDLEPKRLRFTRHSPEKPVNLVLIEARKGGKSGLTFENDLIFYDQNGQMTREFQEFYHREE